MGDNSLNSFLRDNLKLCRRSLVAVAIFSFCVNLLMLSVPLYLLQLYDRVVPNRSGDTLLFLTAIMISALIALASLEAIRSFILVKIGHWLDRQLSEHLLSGTIVRRVYKQRGSSVRALRDLATVRNFFWDPALLSILDIPWTPLFVFVLFMLHPLIGGITLAGVIILLVLVFVNEKLTRPLIQRSGDASSKLLDNASTIVRNADAIEAMGMRNNLVKLWQKSNEDSLSDHVQAIRRGGWISAGVKFLRFGLQIAVIGSAAWLIINGELTGGAMIASILLMRRAVSPMDTAIGSWKSVQKVRAALQQVSKYLDVAPTLRDSPDLPEPNGNLVVNKLTYRHRGSSKPVLYKIDFQLQPGESLGLVGPSAAGKTTLARLLVGIAWPTSGVVRIGGIDIGNWDSEHRGPFIGYLPQNVEMFSGTFRQNIARMADGELEAVGKAAEIAGVHDLILQFPKGYETEIGEEGAYLSGGQRQRIALARAIYGTPKLVVLDEPDANLDREGRAALINVIKYLKQTGTIVILITHHSDIVRYLDKVMILKKARAEVLSNSSEKPKEKPYKRGREADERTQKVNLKKGEGFP